MNPIHVDLFN